MIEEQQQKLIKQQQPTQTNIQSPPILTSSADHSAHIRSVRLRKQLQFLTKYKYTVQQHQQHTSIIINNLWQQQHNNHPINQQNFENTIIGTTLKIDLPKDYPFKPPIFTHNNIQNLSIAQLIDQWSPRYKIMEMIELIKKRIQQRKQLEYKIGNNFVFKIFRNMDSLWVWIFIAILVRIFVGMGSYSGKGDWPNLGDFQAHRNWMSVTLNKPITKWYVQLDTQPWWRIDYPPVAAYLSLFLAQIYNKIQPQAMLLQRGYQSQNLFAFMRSTVLILDCLLLMIPTYLIAKHYSPLRNRYRPLFISLIFILFIKPDLILIDHGHFQYNCLMLGLILYAYYFLITGRMYLCCIVYTLAVNSKLMAVYFTPAFLAGLIGLTIRKYSISKKYKIAGQFITYFLIVIVTLIVIWLPWLGSKQNLMSVIHAIFPIHRGLYQLKVPNFWCISDVIMKYQSFLQKRTLALICLISCFTLSIPSMLSIITNPSSKILTIAFSTISMIFFMFAYHVHQKSILVPLCIIPFISQYLGGSIVMDLIIGACVGMYHLLKEDGQQMEYYVMMIIFIVFGNMYYRCQESFIKVYQPQNNAYYHQPNTINNSNKNKQLKVIQNKQNFAQYIHFKYFTTSSMLHNILIYGGIIFLHVGQLTITPPKSLPYLWHLLFAFYCFVINSYFLVLSHWILISDLISRLKGKKKQ